MNPPQLALEGPSNKALLAWGGTIISVIAALVSTLVVSIFELKDEKVKQELVEIMRNLERVEKHLERIDERSLLTSEAFIDVRAKVSGNTEDIESLQDSMQRMNQRFYEGR